MGKTRKSIRRWWYELKAKFLTRFGSIKVFRFPMFIVYDPSYFDMSGKKIRDVLEILEPGDIILRGYRHYLDGFFIPGDYSHGAIYVGDNTIVHAVAAGVSEIDVVDFCMCDRIAILRPSKLQASAIKCAKKFVKDNVPYDFGFSRDASALYCFELCAECYKKLDVQPQRLKALFGLLKKTVYTADSFFSNPNFKKIFEFNPKRQIDFHAD